MKLMNFAAVISLLFSGSGAMAAMAQAPQRIVVIQQDSSPGNTYIDIAQNDDGSIQSLVYEGYPTLTFTIAQLEAQPAVLMQAGGKNVVTLALQQPFDPLLGGYVNVQYLNNGLYNVYKDFRILITIEDGIITFSSDPDSSDSASDGNKYTGVFNKLFMTTNYFFGQQIGVSYITPSLVPEVDVTSGASPTFTTAFSNFFLR